MKIKGRKVPRPARRFSPVPTRKRPRPKSRVAWSKVGRQSSLGEETERAAKSRTGKDEDEERRCVKISCCQSVVNRLGGRTCAPRAFCPASFLIEELVLSDSFQASKLFFRTRHSLRLSFLDESKGEGNFWLRGSLTKDWNSWGWDDKERWECGAALKVLGKKICGKRSFCSRKKALFLITVDKTLEKVTKVSSVCIRRSLFETGSKNELVFQGSCHEVRKEERRSLSVPVLNGIVR